MRERSRTAKQTAGEVAFHKDAALCLKEMGYLETSGGLNVPLNFILQLTVAFCIKNSTCVWGRSVTFQD